MAAKAAAMSAASTFTLAGVATQSSVGKTRGVEECHVAVRRSSPTAGALLCARKCGSFHHTARNRQVVRRRHVVSAVVAQSSDVAAVAENATSDSVVAEVAALEEEPGTDGVAAKSPLASATSAAPKRKGSPLARGGTLSGAAAAGKDPGAVAVGKAPVLGDGEKFNDPRWKNGTWDLGQFTTNGTVNWDAVIDAEVIRRKWLEDNPEASTNEDPVFFDTSVVPWWAWVKRFHLPEAELLNGRAAMVGFVMAYLVDAATGAGLVDQMGNFFGKILLLVTIVGVLAIRKNEDVQKYKGLAEEVTFYDKQWQATWKEGPPPSNAKKEGDA